MKRKIFSIIFTITITLFFGQLNAQNILSKEMSGFERSGKGWWVHNKNEKALSFSSKRMNRGKYSLKYRSFSSKENDGKTSRVSFSSKKANNIKIKSGTHRIKLNVWVDNVAPEGFNIIFYAPDFISTKWDVSDVPKGRWIELEQEVELGKSPVGKFKMIISFSPKSFGQKGVIYIDDVILEKK